MELINTGSSDYIRKRTHLAVCPFFLFFFFDCVLKAACIAQVFVLQRGNCVKHVAAGSLFDVSQPQRSRPQSGGDFSKPRNFLLLQLPRPPEKLRTGFTNLDFHLRFQFGTDDHQRLRKQPVHDFPQQPQHSCFSFFNHPAPAPMASVAAAAGAALLAGLRLEHCQILDTRQFTRRARKALKRRTPSRTECGTNV